MGQFLLRPGAGSDLAILAFLYQEQPHGKAHVVVLTGESAPIHDHNWRLGNLDLDTKDKVEAYLPFFCDNLVSDDSPYTVIPDTMRNVVHEDGSWTADAQTSQRRSSATKPHSGSPKTAP